MIDSLTFLNLANTKLGNKGASELAKLMRDEGNTKRCNRGKLRFLDISHTNIGSVGFLNILGRLKKSQTLVSLNASNNDFSERPTQFGQLENLLRQNQRIQVLNLAKCSLLPEVVASIAKGMQANASLTRLVLSENPLIGGSLGKLCDALAENRAESRLTDLELSKCNVTSEHAKHMIRLMGSKHKLRHLNLKDNSIQDEAAQEMLGVLMHSNTYITRLNVDFNPIKHQILRDIDAQTKLNVLKVNEQEIPSMQIEINEVKSRTAYLLTECAKEPLLKDKVLSLIGHEAVDVLKRLNIRTKIVTGRHQQPSQTKMHLDGISKPERRALLNGGLFTSGEIVQLYQHIGSLHKSMDQQKESLFEQFHAYDAQKDEMMAQQKAVYMEFKQEQ